MDAMESITFNYASARAAKARISHRLKGTLHRLFFVLAVILVIIGGSLLVIEMTIGWLILGLGSVPYMIHQWYVHGLAELPVANNPKTIDDKNDG